MAYRLTENSSILISGGTGSFGQKFVETVLGRYPKIRRLVIYSRDELKQYEMAQKFSPQQYPGLRYFLGDVRDFERLRRAFEQVDIVIHAAALKQVPAAEYNPIEFIKTNVLGAQNVLQAALDLNIERVVALSTDKAAAPVNLYGASKLCSDKLFIAANNIRGRRKTRFAVVRYGNVMGSRGSVIPFFLQQRLTGVLPITDPSMTRFNISLQEGVNMVLWTIENMQGGEIFVPKIPSYRLMDVAKAIGPHCQVSIVGIRPGEKIHEEMITEADSYTTVDLDRYYAILPVQAAYSLDQYCERTGARRVQAGFRYNSGENEQFLTVEQLQSLIQQHVDLSFEPVQV